MHREKECNFFCQQWKGNHEAARFRNIVIFPCFVSEGTSR